MFRLHESPKFLVASNQPSAAVVSLRRISKINGKDSPWALSDVVDGEPASGSLIAKSPPGYEATGHTSPESRPRSSMASPLQVPSTALEDGELSDFTLPASVLSADDVTDTPKWIKRLPRPLRGAANEYADRLGDLLAPKWRKTTICVWMIWTLASAGYTVRSCPRARSRMGCRQHPSSRRSSMFSSQNSSSRNSPTVPLTGLRLPKRLCKHVGSPERASYCSRADLGALDVLYTLSGLPGSLFGAWLVETPLGRAKTLAISTLATSAATMVFVFVSSSVGIVLSSMAVSFASTLMCTCLCALVSLFAASILTRASLMSQTPSSTASRPRSFQSRCGEWTVNEG